MKYVIVVAAMLSLAACAPPQYQLFGTPGDPNGASYVGSTGSVYDQAANPPSKLSVATYNPEAPIAPNPDDAPPPVNTMAAPTR
jgi:hypothetical protein